MTTLFRQSIRNLAPQMHLCFRGKFPPANVTSFFSCNHSSNRCILYPRYIKYVMEKNSSSVPISTMAAGTKRANIFTLQRNLTATPQSSWTGKARKKCRASKAQEAEDPTPHSEQKEVE